jgi:EAL domain-containing protein (putative c-di-GMP-specific phosphodiesterase class I)
MDAADTAVTTLDALHAHGVRIAIDDFGTGYSSLAYLKRFSVDDIKIDGAFVQDLVDDAGSRAIVQSVIGICEALSLDAVAERVETEEQLAALAAIGCTRAQGFLVAPALPIDEFEALVRGQRLLPSATGPFGTDTN